MYEHSDPIRCLNQTLNGSVDEGHVLNGYGIFMEREQVWSLHWSEAPANKVRFLGVLPNTE